MSFRPTPTSARTHRGRSAAIAGAAAAATVAFDPVHRHVPLCPLHAATGLWCPLCGGLRAVDSLARGHVTAALHYNALVVAALPIVTLWWLDAMHRSRTGLPRRRLPTALFMTCVLLAAAFTVVRNLPSMQALRSAT